MKKLDLRTLIFLSLCCDLGLFVKRVVSPFANVITDALHIPGGVGTAFSLMFLVVAAGMFPRFGYATIMAAAQSLLAFSLGMVGSMGALAPIGYIVPGIVMDAVWLVSRKVGLPRPIALVLMNMSASLSACLTANCLVFQLQGVVLLLYLAVAALSGMVCGLLAGWVVKRLESALSFPCCPAVSAT